DDNLLFATALHWFWFGLGHYREARRRIETALERSGGARTRARGRALSSLAMYFALQGERVAIGPVAEESVAILRETAGPSVDLVCALVALGQSRLLAGDLVGAARVLAEALGVARAVRPRYWITYALYWQGCVAQASLGVAAFEAAFRAGQALSLSSALDLAESIVGEPAAAPRPAGAQVLRVNALGPLEISVDGERLPDTAWSDAKPRELLLYLLCHPGGRTGDQIGLTLWRDASPAQRRNQFHVTLDQLRRTLGRPEWIVFEEERYRINPRLAVEFDG